jgi:ubiquinone biosynthesis protein
MNITQKFKDLKRIEQILSSLVKYELGHFVNVLKMKHIIPAYLRARKESYIKTNTDPKTIKNILEELGGAFIKLGQFLSLRPDLIPHEYCEKFRELDDNVKSFNGDIAKKIVEEELKKINKKLIYFNKKPIASGSIAQVHEAIIENKKILIKIKRPNIENIFSSDISILKLIAKLLNERYEHVINLNEIVEEFEKYTNDELNLMHEANNMQIFYNNFKEDKDIKIPLVYLNYCSKNVLVMEYIHGIKFQKVLSFNIKRKKEISKKYSDAIFKQIFVHRFFHADPHPGNMILLKNDKIAFVDFGITGEISNELLDKLKLTFISLISGNAEEFTESLINLNIAKKNINKENLTNQLKNLLRDYYNKSLDKMNFGIILNKAFHIAKRNHLHLPSELVLLGKTLITVEGVCVEIDPKFNIVKTYKPHLIEFEINDYFVKFKDKMKKMKNLFFNFPEKTETFMEDIKEVDQSMKDIDQDLKKLNTNIIYSVDIIGLSLLFIGFLVSSVILMNFGEPFIAEIPLTSFIGFILSMFFLVILTYKILKTKKI